jgi:hypothetical protein
MSVETDIVAALGPLVSGRVYADTAPANAAKPFVIYQQVGGKPVAFLESGIVGKRNGRFQVACWGANRLVGNGHDASGDPAFGTRVAV